MGRLFLNTTHPIPPVRLRHHELLKSCEDGLPGLRLSPLPVMGTNKTHSKSHSSTSNSYWPWCTLHTTARSSAVPDQYNITLNWATMWWFEYSSLRDCEILFKIALFHWFSDMVFCNPASHSCNIRFLFFVLFSQYRGFRGNLTSIELSERVRV